VPIQKEIKRQAIKASSFSLLFGMPCEPIE